MVRTNFRWGVLLRAVHPSGWLRVLGAVSVIMGCGSGETGASWPDEQPLRIISAQVLPTEFGGVAGAVRLSSGEIAVADAGRAHLRVFATANDSGVTLGRRGRGPGEFDLLYRLHSCSDSLFAYDYSEARLHIFTSSRFVRQLQLPATLTGADFVGCAGADSLYFTKMPDQLPGKGNQMFPMTVLRFSTQTNNLAWVTSLQGTEMFVSERHAAFYERPFAHRTIFAAGPGGPVVIESHSSSLRRLEATSGEELITLRGVRIRPVTNIDKTRYLDARLAAEPDTIMRGLIRAVHSEMEWGERVPIFDALVASADGRVFARLSPGVRDTVAAWLGVREGEPVLRRLTLKIGDRLLFVDASTAIVLRARVTGEEDVLLLKISER